MATRTCSKTVTGELAEFEVTTGVFQQDSPILTITSGPFLFSAHNNTSNRLIIPTHRVSLDSPSNNHHTRCRGTTIRFDTVRYCCFFSSRHKQPPRVIPIFYNRLCHGRTRKPTRRTRSAQVEKHLLIHRS